MILKGKNKPKGPVVLLLLDGLGVAPESEGNVLSKAEMPNYQKMISRYPVVTLEVPVFGRGSVKRVNLAANYYLIGTGEQSLKKGSLSLADVVKKSGLKWKFVTETEKYALGAYFFSGKKKANRADFSVAAFDGAGKYRLEPEMAAKKAALELIKNIKSKNYHFLTASLAGLDMMVHAGDWPAALEAAAAIDFFLGKIVKTVLENNGLLFVTAAAGGAEEMIDVKTETENRANSSNPVPFVVVGREWEGKNLGQEAPANDLSLLTPAGSLLDIAPTIIDSLGLEIPPEMQGRSLLFGAGTNR